MCLTVDLRGRTIVSPIRRDTPREALNKACFANIAVGRSGEPEFSVEFGGWHHPFAVRRRFGRGGFSAFL